MLCTSPSRSQKSFADAQPPPKQGYVPDVKPVPLYAPNGPPLDIAPHWNPQEWVYHEVAPKHLIEALVHEYYNSIYPM